MDNSKLLVLTGFCIVASISAKRFIQSLSDRVLSELKEVKNEVKDVKKDVDVLADKETEDVSKLTELTDEDGTMTDSALNPNDSNRIKILKCLSDNRFTFRSIKGLSKKIELPEPQITELINELISEKYVDQSVRESGIRFYITKEGREFFHFYNTTSMLQFLRNIDRILDLGSELEEDQSSA